MNFESFKNRIAGTVIAEYDPRYRAVADALVWNGRKPTPTARLIVRAHSVADVQEAVRYAAENNLTVSPRGAGHQFTGIAARADMVIDLGALNSLNIDVESRTARIEPAVTNERLATVLDRHDLGFPVGHCGSVPMSGYLLGGGFGWNSAAWGIACFLVDAVEVVLASGELVTATETQYPDIFWAARGAGPYFFGVVVAYQVRLLPGPRAISTSIRVYPAAAASEVAAWAEEVMAEAPSCVEFTAKVSGSPGGPIIAAIATVFADSEAAGSAIHAGLSRCAPSGAIEVVGPFPSPIPALLEATEPSMLKGNRYCVDTVWSDASYVEALTRVAQEMEAAPTQECFALVVLRSNAVMTPSSAAFSTEGRIFIAINAICKSAPDDDFSVSWLRRTIDVLSPLGKGAYVGEADLDRPDRVLPTHSLSAVKRIADLARHFDPDGRFASSHRQLVAGATTRVTGAETLIGASSHATAAE